MMFRVNVQDNNDDVKAYVTKPTLVITRVRVLHFTRQDKDTLQRRLMILMSFCFKFIRVYTHQSNIERLTKLLLK